MKNIISFTYYLLPAIVNSFSSCVQDSNTVKFSINISETRIYIPVLLNDSIIANMIFDSGSVAGAFRLDSSFVAKHPSLIPSVRPDTILSGSLWSDYRAKNLKYPIHGTFKIGDAELTYDNIYIYDMRKAIGAGTDSDGIMNFPEQDTTHVWEWNFEHNYLRIHLAENFAMPNNCCLFSLSKRGYYDNYIQLPLQMACSDGDTIAINESFWVDMGIPDEIALMYPAKELEFFQKRTDATCFSYLNDYYCSYWVNVALSNHFRIDSVCVNIFDKSYGLPGEYIVGLNFLKRFNVFFDRKNRILGLQPVKNYSKITNTWNDKFYYQANKNNIEGKYLVTKMANYKENYFYTAGLRVGDEIVSINGVFPEDIDFFGKKQAVFEKDTLFYDIIRKGELLQIAVPVDKNEIQGD